MIRLALRNIRRNRRRSLLSGFAIAVSVLSILTLLSFVDGMQSDMKENLLTYYSGEVRLRHSEYSTYERFTPLHLSLDEEAVRAALSTLPQPVTATARTAVPISFRAPSGEHHGVAIGVEAFAAHPIIDFSSLLVAGVLPKPLEQEVLLGSSLAHTRNLAVADELILFGRGVDGAVRSATVTVVGIVQLPVSELNASAIYLELSTVQEFLAMEGAVQEFFLYSQIKEKPTHLAKRVDSHLGTKGISLESRSFDQINELYGFFVIVYISYAFIALLFFFLGSTVIINTTMMAIYERMPEIGTMKALGMDDRSVRRLFVLEGAIISLLGAVVGLLLGLGIVGILGQVGIDFTDALSGVQMEVSTLLYPQVRLSSCILVFIFGTLVATLATYVATRHSERVGIVAALYDR